jgi:glycine oxidase
VIGLSLAWRLTQQNVKVTVVDAGRAGGEASWAAAGMLAPGGELGRDTPWSRFSLLSHQLYPGFAQELAEESGIDPQWCRCGALSVAGTDIEWDALQARAVAQRVFGIPSEAVDATQIRELAPGIAPGVWQGRWYADDAMVNPRELTRALAVACQKRGAQVLEQTRVLSVSGGEVRTADRVLDADVVVIAAGAWSREIAAGETLPLTRPVRGHLIGYWQPLQSLQSILRRDHTYLLQRENGFLIAGSSEERAGFNREIDTGIAEDVQRRAEALLPQLLGEKYESWVGFRPGTPTGHPALQRAGERLWLAYGHYRNGILQAPATAERIAGEILNARPALCPSTSMA